MVFSKSLTHVINCIVWIYAVMVIIPGERICESEPVVHVCTLDDVDNATEVYIDTSKTPVQEAVTCVCTVKALDNRISGTVNVNFGFVDNPDITNTSFTMHDKGTNENIDVPSNGIGVVHLSDEGLDVVYQQPEETNDQSCLSIKVTGGTRIGVTCKTKSTSENTGIKTTKDTEDVSIDGETRNLVPIVIGTVCGICTVVIVAVVIIIVARRNRRKPNTSKDESNDSCEDEEVENPMYNLEGDSIGPVHAAPTKMNSNYIEPTDRIVDPSYDSSNDCKRPGNDVNYTLPHDSIDPKNIDAYGYNIPDEVNYKASGNIDEYDLPSGDEYSYSTLSDNNCHMKNKAPKLCQNLDNPGCHRNMKRDENVYDHTTDKTVIVQMNEYSRLRNARGKIPITDCLNTYDTSGNGQNWLKRKTAETEDHYDKTT